MMTPEEAARKAIERTGIHECSPAWFVLVRALRDAEERVRRETIERCLEIVSGYGTAATMDSE